MADIARQNWRSYNRRDVARKWAAYEDKLFKAEECILRKIAAEVREQPLLDLGVGGGRTAPHLRALSSQYVGVDYAPEMISFCRGKYPGLRFEVADARNMGIFPRESFGCVMFSFNGLDYLPHEDRLRVMSEVHRILRSNGLFIFSSHNRQFHTLRAYDPRRIKLSLNPLRSGSRILSFIAGIVNYLRFRFLTYEGPDYSYKLRGGENFCVVSYNIGVQEQIVQLDKAGFVIESVYDINGEVLRSSGDHVSPWLYYVARKKRAEPAC